VIQIYCNNTAITKSFLLKNGHVFFTNIRSHNEHGTAHTIRHDPLNCNYFSHDSNGAKKRLEATKADFPPQIFFGLWCIAGAPDDSVSAAVKLFQWPNL
jgi:hypothetical protein